MKINNIFFIILLHFFCVFAQGQETLPVSNQKQYMLGGIELSGDHHLDKKSILKIMELSIGQTINVPGEEVSNGLKMLWEQDLFSDIQISKIEKNENIIILKLYLKASLSLLKFSFNGIKKSEEENIREKLNFSPGISVTPNLITTSKQKVENYFIEKGFLQASCTINTISDSINPRKVILEFNINKNIRLKIDEIIFSGNLKIKSRKLKKVMKDTRETGLRYLLSTSKLVEKDYQNDLINVINLYRQKGYRDATITNDFMYITDDGKIILNIEIYEGGQYFFGDISWLGNTKYDSERLTEVLRIKEGDIFDATLLDERLNMSRNGDDVSALYMDDGYLFFRVNPVEVSVQGNFINLEIQMIEGEQATIKNVTIKGNTKTNDHVLMREVRSLPGELFKRSDIVRTQEELNNLGFFNPEALGVNPMPDPKTGEVDIEYVVEEKQNDQIEMSGGYGNRTFVGRAAVTFNNFSTKGISDKSTWSPLPTGDGQKVQLSVQSYGARYQTYRLLFQEPWLGGKKPNSFSTSFWYSVQRQTEFTIANDETELETDSLTIEPKLSMAGFSVGLGKRATWPDDYFSHQHSFNINRYDTENWYGSGTPLTGIVNGINYALTIQRNSVFNPIYPRYGSTFSLNWEMTPPYSLFSNKDSTYYANPELTDEERFKFLEYFKIKTKGEWYTTIADNLVLKTKFEFGLLSEYNKDIGLPPFERFYVGGDGLQGYSMDGREIVGVRGYPNHPDLLSGSSGMPIYSKYSAELRYPISLNPMTTIYALCFAEGANAWASPKTFNPFEVKRSLGVGIRIFLPMVGIMGVDFGYGFDALNHDGEKPGWVPQFTIGQQF